MELSIAMFFTSIFLFVGVIMYATIQYINADSNEANLPRVTYYAVPILLWVLGIIAAISLLSICYEAIKLFLE